MGETRILRSGEMSWRAVEDGAETAVLHGDPDREGLFAVRYRTTKSIRVPAHWHPGDEHITVLAGTFQAGLGEEFREEDLRPYGPGDYLFLPAGVRHYTKYEPGAVVEVMGPGPLVTYYTEV